jgi:hypothetical protein
MSKPAERYPRDLVGYGRKPPDPRWPGGAVIAVQFVVNYEEGELRTRWSGPRVRRWGPLYFFSASIRAFASSAKSQLGKRAR